MKFHEMEINQVEKVLDTDFSAGLSPEVVKKRIAQHGLNELQEGEKQSALLLFFSQFKDFMVLVLLAATLLSGLLGEYIDAVAIIAIVIINGILRLLSRKKSREILGGTKRIIRSTGVCIKGRTVGKNPF